MLIKNTIQVSDIPRLEHVSKTLCAVSGGQARMKHNDVTVIANGTQSNEAMVATKEGLLEGFASLRLPTNQRPNSLV